MARDAKGGADLDGKCGLAIATLSLWCRLEGRAERLTWVGGSGPCTLCSLAGEKLTEHQVILAMQRASRTIGLHVPNFILAPCWGQPPCYNLHLEPDGSGASRALETLAEALERLADDVLLCD